jgi:hypothetical protein
MISAPQKWLLLIHQLPPQPNSFRVRIWRRLKRVGAVAVKQSVYVIPDTEQTREDLSWTLKEIVDGGGDGSIAETHFVEGLTDDQIVYLFRQARKVDYEKLLAEIKIAGEQIGNNAQRASEAVTKTRNLIGRLQKRLDEIISIDFFAAPERMGAENALSSLASGLKDVRSEADGIKAPKRFSDKVWVTRKNVFVDRIASAWLITRFIDRNARFKFVGSKQYTPQKNEVRFDMYEAEFTHQGDRCTFEEILRSFQIKDKALHLLAEIVHDIDLKDHRYGRPEADGLTVMFSGLVSARQTDNDRMKAGAGLLDDLYAYFKGKPQ